MDDVLEPRNLLRAEDEGVDAAAAAREAGDIIGVEAELAQLPHDDGDPLQLLVADCEEGSAASAPRADGVLHIEAEVAEALHHAGRLVELGVAEPEDRRPAAPPQLDQLLDNEAHLLKPADDLLGMLQLCVRHPEQRRAAARVEGCDPMQVEAHGREMPHHDLRLLKVPLTHPHQHHPAAGDVLQHLARVEAEPPEPVHDDGRLLQRRVVEREHVQGPRPPHAHEVVGLDAHLREPPRGVEHLPGAAVLLGQEGGERGPATIGADQLLRVEAGPAQGTEEARDGPQVAQGDPQSARACRFVQLQLHAGLPQQAQSQRRGFPLILRTGYPQGAAALHLVFNLGLRRDVQPDAPQEGDNVFSFTAAVVCGRIVVRLGLKLFPKRACQLHSLVIGYLFLCRCRRERSEQPENHGSGPLQQSCHHP
uniref:Uncharacterized protein n=1 Tax=Tetraselmis sp. GSL018 TaxID=582737 RepID=A0A061RQT6_9CHLO